MGSESANKVPAAVKPTKESAKKQKIALKKKKDDDASSSQALTLSDPILRSCSNKVLGTEDEEFITLSHKSRTHLVCYDETKNLVQFPIRKLKQKTVGLLFLKLECGLFFLKPLIHVYNQIRERYHNSFEIVFIHLFAPDDPVDRSRHIFHSNLRQMPWPAIPFEDPSNWRNDLFRHYFYNRRITFEGLLIFDPLRVLCSHPKRNTLHHLISSFGPDYFPFTAERVSELEAEYKSMLVPRSLEALLCGKNRDFLVSYPNGPSSCTKTPISQLKSKYVALYFFHFNDEKENYMFMEKLETFHMRSRRQFQVVFINLDFARGFSSAASFCHFLSEWPWVLALPFRDEKIRPLNFLLPPCYNHKYANHLVMVGGQDGDFFIDTSGYNIIEEYGYAAFPFTRSKALEIQRNNVTQLKLDSIFNLLGTDVVVSMGKGGIKPISCLQGMEVMVLYLEDISEDNKKRLCDLRHNDIAAVVLFVTEMKDTDFDSLLSTMPENWFSIPPSPRRRFECLMRDKLKVDFIDKDFLLFDNAGNFSKIGVLNFYCTGELVFDYFDDDSFRHMLVEGKDWDMQPFNFPDPVKPSEEDAKKQKIALEREAKKETTTVDVKKATVTAHDDKGAAESSENHDSESDSSDGEDPKAKTAPLKRAHDAKSAQEPQKKKMKYILRKLKPNWYLSYRVAYVEFSNADGFNRALEMDGSDLGGGYYLNVQVAKPRVLDTGFDSTGGRPLRGCGSSGGPRGLGSKSGGGFGGSDGWSGIGSGTPNRPTMTTVPAGKKTIFED